jgi:Transposase DDE domain
MTQDEFSVEAIRRVPVAEGVLATLAVLFGQERMEALYERNRGASYEGDLTFHSVVELMYSAVIEHNAVGSEAFKAARAAEKLSVSDQATYGKIRRIRQSLSNALVCESMQPLMEMFPDIVKTRVPLCFNDYNVYGMDGKKLKDVAKRLKETRGVAGKLLGGKALVALSIHEQLVVAMSSSLDGEANDGPLVPELLEKIHAWSPQLNIILADSQFCDLTTPRRILAYNSDFVMRYHPKVHFHVDPDVEASTGVDNWGRPYVEEIGWLGKPGTKTSIRIRRIVVKREDNSDLIIVTSLLDTKKFSAADVLELYGLRWTIETAFLHVTKEFDLRHMIGSTAQATLFQFAITLIIHNVMRLILAHVSEAQEISPEEISMPKIIRTAKKQMASLSVFVPAAKTADLILKKTPTPARISKMLGKLWDDDWIKARKKTRAPKPPPKKKSGAHTSVYREIQAYRLQKDV